MRLKASAIALGIAAVSACNQGPVDPAVKNIEANAEFPAPPTANAARETREPEDNRAKRRLVVKVPEKSSSDERE